MVLGSRVHQCDASSLSIVPYEDRRKESHPWSIDADVDGASRWLIETELSPTGHHGGHCDEEVLGREKCGQKDHWSGLVTSEL